MQTLMSRKTKTLLPITKELLKPKIPQNIKGAIKHNSKKQELYFNQKVKPLQLLQPRDVVWVSYI